MIKIVSVAILTLFLTGCYTNQMSDYDRMRLQMGISQIQNNFNAMQPTSCRGSSWGGSFTMNCY